MTKPSLKHQKLFNHPVGTRLMYAPGTSNGTIFRVVSRRIDVDTGERFYVGENNRSYHADVVDEMYTVNSF